MGQGELEAVLVETHHLADDVHLLLGLSALNLGAVGLLLVGDVSEVQHRGKHAEHLVLEIRAHVEQGECLPELGEGLGLVDALDVVAAAHVDVAVVLSGTEGVLGLLLLGHAVRHLVKDVEVALSLGLEDEARLLQQVAAHARSDDVVILVELDLDELAEAGGVVVATSLGVTHRLQHGHGGQHHLLDVGRTLGTGREELQDQLGGLSLSSSRLSTDQHGLVQLVLDHSIVGGLGDGEDMGRDLAEAGALVRAHMLARVDGQALIGVDGHENSARVGVDEVLNVAVLEVLQNTVQCHVLHKSHVLVPDTLSKDGLLLAGCGRGCGSGGTGGRLVLLGRSRRHRGRRRRLRRGGLGG
mmetsp:Transcript_21248/g.82449  ORF Transcript_21248/g.82449 Transcript_21248/m.82449 type:complete len:356 (-) Transcript_21248:194-1261(-)